MTYRFDFKSKNELKQLRKKVDDFESGKAYQHMQDEYEKKLAASDRQLKSLQKRLNESDQRNQLLYSDNQMYKRKLAKYELDIERQERWIKNRDVEIKQLEETISAQQLEIAKLKALLNTDGTNSGTPTSRTPLNKDKVRPNSRKNTDQPRGGVKGHRKSNLLSFSEDEINDPVFHPFEDNCPSCDGELKYTGKDITKDETDVEVKVIRRRHKFGIYKCLCCGKEIHLPIPNNLKEQNQYGSSVQAIALSLMNSDNVPINKVGSFISGITDDSVHPCDGYIAKLQKRAAGLLEKFRDDLRNLLIEKPVIYWDDTVIMIDKRRGCLRFYGDERIAWYVAHTQKDLDGIMEDQILQNLSKDTYVMHDHNSINYNKQFIFRNIECNIHLIRDLQKVFQILGHSWANEMCEHIASTIHERKLRIEEGKTEFNDIFIRDFNDKLDRLIEKGRQQNRKDRSQYYGNDEFTLLNRIEKHRENYFLWVTDFSLPTTDSLSERALRGVKSKTKISGQFYSTKTADCYAIIKSYIETCHRNGINEFVALKRLSEGNPFTVQEIFHLNGA